MEEGASEVCWVPEACCCRTACLSPGMVLGKTVGLRVLWTGVHCGSPALAPACAQTPDERAELGKKALPLFTGEA